MDKTEKSVLLVFLIVLISACCLLVVCGGLALVIGGFSGFLSPSMQPTEIPVVAPTKTTFTPTATPFPTFTPTQSEEIGGNSETLTTLQNAFIPSADLIYLAERYEGKKSIPMQLTTPPINYEVGDSLNFNKINTDTNQSSSITAVLRYASEKIYFWVEEGVYVDREEMLDMLDVFENEIYPTNQEFFGTEWIPGVDNDPHLYILYAGDMGYYLAGYNASSDSVLPMAHENSNAHEMFYINSDVQTLSDSYTLSVMAHEFQHLIHGYHDPNEELWVNEGFSELATLLNGFSAGGFDYVFSYDTDVQLNDWSTNSGENDVHYGASFLYVTYLLDRFGEEITKEVVADERDGFGSIDHVFRTNGLTDPSTGKGITADDFFVDWTIANLMNDDGFDDGRYVYNIYPAAPKASITETITSCDGVQLDRTVKQYGTDYIELDCTGEEVELRFSGSPTVPVLPLSSGDNHFMWSNRADGSVTRLSREFDLTAVSAPITLRYETWYDLEVDYDYLYLLVSEGGDNYQLLSMPSCTSQNLTGNNYGCGYNGNSGGWITQEVDLSTYAGKKITLSFEYVTDEAVTAEGFLIDNIRIDTLGYAADFEVDDGGWLTEGFVRIENIIPQTFLVSILGTSAGSPVQKFALNAGETLSLTLAALPPGETYIVVVSGSTRFTRQEASYQIALR
ncbi:MAG TPA: immune inhibitor A [Anaerolineaceae bacterium]|nr:immune inhibitor A [Anaerolineaceae bacterium]